MHMYKITHMHMYTQATYTQTQTILYSILHKVSANKFFQRDCGVERREEEAGTVILDFSLTTIGRVGDHHSHSNPEYHSSNQENSSNRHQRDK